MGPLSARTHQGQALVRVHPGAGQPAGRARQEVDDGRCANEGYVFGALQPATGEVLVMTASARTIATYSDVLAQIAAWIFPAVERSYAIMDNFTVHSASAVVLLSLAHPRWAFVVQPTSAA